MEQFTNVMMRIASVINANKYISAIRDAFVNIMALIIVGSIGVLFGSVVCSTSGLAQFPGFEWLVNYAPLFNQLNSATNSVIAIFVAFGVGNSLAKSNGFEGIAEGLFAVACFFVASPSTITAYFDEAQTQSTSVSGLSGTVIGSQGIFVALLVSLLAVAAYCKLWNNDKLKIHMPDSVPPNVSAQFSSLIPAFIVLLVISLISFILYSTTGMYLSDAIYNILAVPVQAAFQLPIGVILCTILCSLFWICGLHGANLTRGIVQGFMYTALYENADLLAAGQAPTNVVTYPFWDTYVTIGGSGSTLALIIAIFIFSHRDDYKAIARLGLAPGIFEINEPMIFGLPVVMNPILAIPFVLAPLASCIIGYVATAIGFAGKAVVIVPWVTPPIFNAFLSTGGNVGAVITQIICFIVQLAIFAPFVIMSNHMANTEAQANS